MADSGAKKWLKGCGVGCGLAILLFVAISVGSSVFLLRPFKSAVKVRETLDERYGGQADYQPAADGAIAEERMKAFLVVRAALMDHCPGFAATDERLERLDSLDDDTSKKQVFTEVLGLSKAMMGMGPAMGDFFVARNEALLELGMGRGEYTYIYLLAFRDELLELYGREHDAPMLDSGGPNSRVRRALAQVLRNQREAVVEATDTMDAAAREQWLEQLDDEIYKLEKHERRLLWEDDLPAPIAASIEPFRARLEELFCAQTVGLEFTRNRVRVLGIQGD